MWRWLARNWSFIGGLAFGALFLTQGLQTLNSPSGIRQIGGAIGIAIAAIFFALVAVNAWQRRKRD
jgi:uncharacterized membrane protein YphA (DoxX/SURF4 family)